MVAILQRFRSDPGNVPYIDVARPRIAHRGVKRALGADARRIKREMFCMKLFGRRMQCATFEAFSLSSTLRCQLGKDLE